MITKRSPAFHEKGCTTTSQPELPRKQLAERNRVQSHTPDLYRLFASSTVLKNLRCPVGWQGEECSRDPAGVEAVGRWAGRLRTVDIGRAHCRLAALEVMLRAARAAAVGWDIVGVTLVRSATSRRAASSIKFKLSESFVFCCMQASMEPRSSLLSESPDWRIPHAPLVLLRTYQLYRPRPALMHAKESWRMQYASTQLTPLSRVHSAE